MTPMDIKTEGEWKQIVEEFAGKVAMTTCLTDADGAHPSLCHPERYPVCAAIRADPDSATFICSKVNVAMLAVARKTLRPVIDMCDAGLFRLVVPLVRDGVLVGQVIACGVASDDEDEELDAFLLSKQLGIPEEEVLELARATPAAAEDDLMRHADQLFVQLNSGE